MDLSQVLKRPVVTEKTSQIAALGQYVFKVDKRANKEEIRKAVEEFFKVHVQNIQTAMVRGKKKKVGRSRREFKQPDWKRAIVQLKAGEKIEVFETGD